MWYVHVNCSNILIDQNETTAGSFTCVNCLQQSITFTKQEDIYFSDLYTPNARQQMFEEEYDRLKNIVSVRFIKTQICQTLNFINIKVWGISFVQGMEETLQKKYIRFVQIHRKDFIPSKSATLCSVHFAETCFESKSVVLTFTDTGKPLQPKRYLIKGSVPIRDVVIPHMSHFDCMSVVVAPVWCVICMNLWSNTSFGIELKSVFKVYF